MTSTPLLEQGDELRRVASGTRWAEGPVWLPERRAVRFSDIPNNRIVEFSEETGDLTVFRDDAEFTNGRTLDLEGNVVECSHGRRAIQRDTAVRPGNSPAPRTLVDRYASVRLNSPNDVVVKSDGTIWFTDPSYGIMRPDEGHPGEEEYGDRYVFRFDPQEGSVVPVVIDIEAPNGLAFSPDEKTLYVTDSSVDPASGTVDPDRRVGHAIHAYDVYGGRHAKNGRVFTEVVPGLPDGIRVDEHGNVWSSSLDAVQVFTPAGERILQILVPEKVGNLCFGGDDGRTLYVAATSGLYRIRTTVRDAVHVARKAATAR